MVTGRKASVVALLAATALTAGGCRADQSAKDQSANKENEQRLSKDNYVLSAEAICARYGRKLMAISAPKTFHGIARYARKALPLESRGIGELDRLQPPKELERSHDSWIAARRSLLKVERDLMRAVQGNDQARASQIYKGVLRNGRIADRAGRKLGLLTCMHNPYGSS
jgi:hypothetical protein